MANATTNTSKPLKIGYIGLGHAGYPLASTLSRAGYALVVRDADTSRSQAFASEHAHATAADPADPEAFSNVDVLVTMLPNGEIVKEVLLGASSAETASESVAKHLKEGCVIIDTSSSSPYHTRHTASLLSRTNPTLTLIDSPITQAYAFALAKGDATLMVGCSSPMALEKAMPVLRTMGRHVFVMGELGAGHAMKTLNNYVSAASICGLCDALVAGEKGFNLDPAKMLDVMNVGTGINFSTKESFRTDVGLANSLTDCFSGLTRRHQSGYQLSLLLKDMKIAREVINQSGMHSELSDLIVENFADADRVAGPGADHTQVLEGWEKKAGFQLRQSEQPEK